MSFQGFFLRKWLILKPIFYATLIRKINMVCAIPSLSHARTINMDHANSFMSIMIMMASQRARTLGIMFMPLYKYPMICRKGREWNTYCKHLRLTSIKVPVCCAVNIHNNNNNPSRKKIQSNGGGGGVIKAHRPFRVNYKKRNI